MNHSKFSKSRTCKTCEVTFQVTAQEMREHANLCRRMTAIGMVGLVNSANVIVTPEQDARERQLVKA